MKTLVLITNSFPFGIAEKSFIEPELNELRKKFKVVIVARNVEDEQTTEVDEIKVYRYNSKKNYDICRLFFKSIIKKDLYREIYLCNKNKRLNFRNLKTILSVMMRTIHFSGFLKEVRNNIEADHVMYYTYWNDYATYSCTKIKNQDDLIVSRIHRADLYLMNSRDWLAYKHITNNMINGLYFISNEGRNYYTQIFGKVPGIMNVHYLGVKKQNKTVSFEPSNKLRLLSFSYLSQVKRVDYLIDILSRMENIKIEWTHIGGGVLEENIRQKAIDKLANKNNISYTFTGYMQNDDAMKFISEKKFDFLVNVSYSEGLPVTMMEAMSLGIPVIGTDVGGVSEIISDKVNGYLISRDFDVDELINVLNSYVKTSLKKKLELRKNALSTWRNKFYDKNNYVKFSKELEELNEN